MKEISATELRQRLARKDRIFLLDVRQPDEYAAGHINGAVLIPLGELPQRLGELRQDDEIVVNCKSGGRSAKACELLSRHGFAHVTNLKGGFLGWQAEG